MFFIGMRVADRMARMLAPNKKLASCRNKYVFIEMTMVRKHMQTLRFCEFEFGAGKYMRGGDNPRALTQLGHE